jgi:hypothetical protein
LSPQEKQRNKYGKPFQENIMGNLFKKVHLQIVQIQTSKKGDTNKSCKFKHPKKGTPTKKIIMQAMTMRAPQGYNITNCRLTYVDLHHLPRLAFYDPCDKDWKAELVFDDHMLRDR